MLLLGGWDGYRLGGWHREALGEARWLVFRCCPIHAADDTAVAPATRTWLSTHRTLRRVRDLPLFDESVELEVRRQRLPCPRCGPKLEQLDWLEKHARVTQRLA